MYVRKKIYLFLLFRALFVLNVRHLFAVAGNHIPLRDGLDFSEIAPVLDEGVTGTKNVTLRSDMAANAGFTTLEFVVPSTAVSPKEVCPGGCSRDYMEIAPVTENKLIYIGGLFDLSCSCKTGINGDSELAAAELAVSHVNKFQFIPGYNLKLLYNNTQCDAGIATDALYDFIYRRKHEIIMLMGSACADVTKTLAEIVPYWNLTMISHATTSPALSERKKYSTFFRLSPGDSSLNPARRMFIQNFRWDTVAALYEDKDLYALAITDMSEHFEMNNITLRPTIAFKDVSEIPEKMKHLKEKDVRIIIGGFSDQAARQVFCEAYKLGMYGARYVWILIGGYTWWNMTSDTTCTLQQIKKAMSGYITVSSVKNLHNEEKSLSNLSSSEFIEEYNANNGTKPISLFAETSYDTVWTIALTIKSALHSWTNVTTNSTSPAAYNDVDDVEVLKRTFDDVIENLEFRGVSGPVSFQGPDRVGIVAVYQRQGDKLKPIAIHDPAKNTLQFNCSKCVTVVWQGERVPRDKKIIRHRQATISRTVFYVSYAFCSVGIIMAFCFLVFNLSYRKLRYIKLSSPILNDVAVIGCIMVYTAVIVLGLDDGILPRHVFPFICTTRVLLFAAGFSLAFGAMFAKTYRVHQIFTRAHTGLVKSKLLRDKHLLFMIGALLVIDSAIVFVWVLVDPMQRQITNLTSEASAEDEDIWYISQLATCHSNHMQKWTGVFYVYKGLLLIFGVYMAWETRSVKIPALNDSQYIGMNVYNVVIMSISVVVLSNILAMDPTLAYSVESSFMVLSTTVTLCLLFVPKIYVIVTCGGNPVIASSGIHVEANTRRFVVDDRKEKYYRAEVQNRVYKRELIEVEQELSRLQRLMELPLEPFSRMTDELLHLLPESKVDGTPAIERRRMEEKRKYLSGCNSISDDGEVCYGSEETDGFPEMHREDSTESPRGSEKRHSAQENSESTLKRLCRISRSLSITHTPPLGIKTNKQQRVPSPIPSGHATGHDPDPITDNFFQNVNFRNNSSENPDLRNAKRNSDNLNRSPQKNNRYIIGFEKFGSFNNLLVNREEDKNIHNNYLGHSDLELNLIRPECRDNNCGNASKGKSSVGFSDSSFSVPERRRKLHSPPPHIRVKHAVTKCDISFELPSKRLSQKNTPDSSGLLDNKESLQLESLTLTHQNCKSRNAHVSSNGERNLNLYNNHYIPSSSLAQCSDRDRDRYHNEPEQHPTYQHPTYQQQSPTTENGQQHQPPSSSSSSPTRDNHNHLLHHHQSLSEQSSSSSYSNEMSTETTSSTSPTSPKHDVTSVSSPFSAKNSSYKILQPQRHLGTINEKDGNSCSNTEMFPGSVFEPVHENELCTGAIPKDVQNSQRKHRALCRVDSMRTVERRNRIRKLQSDLLKIQKELQDLDEMEYDVSEV